MLSPEAPLPDAISLIMEVKETTKTPGVSISGSETKFCYYCTDATRVKCEVFDDYSDTEGQSYDMEADDDGYWHLTVKQDLTGKWYGYYVKHPEKIEKTNPYRGKLFADPYSRHVTVNDRYDQQGKTYIFDDSFDWAGDQHQYPDDPRDLVIYETHLKDCTAHPSSGASGDSFYDKFVDLNQKGGIAHLKKLGVNCVEFLPLQKYAPVEPPYGEETDEGFFNSWNPYAENYWGYMTSFFFAPENSLSSDGSGKIRGYTTAAVSEFKSMVKELHNHGITVLMDVVYNHTSLFDRNPLTHLCSHSYLRYNDKGQLMNRSGTGNEFRSEAPVARQLILDSLKYWVKEYHVDGFRFDLAALLDLETWRAIQQTLHDIDPRIVLIAEPWGGHYAPAKFSEYDWASWNDRIRNSIKGSDPQHDRGFIFSEWQHETSRGRLENIIRGTLKEGDGGLFDTSAHSVNYLESHDGYTLADFIRIGLNPELQDHVIENPIEFNKLNDTQMSHAKFAALTLFVSQGMTMIHAGQEFGRSKIIVDSDAKDPDTGKIDHNSYQKDNATNWLNFDILNLNRDLFNYYRGLIDIRLSSAALRKAKPEEIIFDHFDNPLLLSYYIKGTSSGDIYDYYVILNANWADTISHHLPQGSWELIVNKQIASSQAFDILSGIIDVPAKSGVVLRKFRH